MTAALRQTWQINLRYLRAFIRQPAWVAIALVQPIIWLLLFGALFKSVVDIPGFLGTSYIAFLTPGVAVMTAVMSAGWNGMGFIEDMRRGVLDRVLVTPLWRGALNAGSLLYAIITLALQVLIIVGIGLLAGASFKNGVAGVAVLVLVACLLGGSVAALSNGLALVAKQRETLIGAVTFVTLPITFLSFTFMQKSLVPHWVQSVARYNPVNWAVEAGRSATGAHTDWALVGSRIGFLVLLLLVSATIATRAFNAYQRSI
ncbi:MAG TPA: ABC transporter permease [Gaiellaceae bacterium]|nr:ABC transporter permease [Gaiellaceae bacterium]